jgi:hypothetical protein
MRHGQHRDNNHKTARKANGLGKAVYYDPNKFALPQHEACLKEPSL